MTIPIPVPVSVISLHPQGFRPPFRLPVAVMLGVPVAIGLPHSCLAIPIPVAIAVVSNSTVRAADQDGNRGTDNCFTGGDLIEERKRLGHYLVHVVVLIG